MRKIEKIFEYIERHGLSVSDFERKSGLSNSYLASTRKRDSDISYKALNKIKENLRNEYFEIFPEEKKGDYIPKVMSHEYEKNESEINNLKSRLKDKDEVITSKEKLITHLEKQITERDEILKDMKLNLERIERTVKISLGYAQTLYLRSQEHFSLTEQKEFDAIQRDMDRLLAEAQIRVFEIRTSET